MELIIKIPENTYRQIQALARNGYFEHDICGNSMRRIANGTPLPKGHGDLIDRNSILCDDLSCDLCGYTDECFKLLAPTIIEKDTKSGEQK